MGQEIVYCFKCLTRLVGGDFEKGTAFRHGPRVSCKACLPHLLQDLNPAEQEEFMRASKPVDRTPSGVMRPATTRRRAETETVPPPGKGKSLGLALGGGALLLLVIGLVLLRSPATAAPPPEPPKVAPAPAPENEFLKAARRALEKARDPSVTDPDARLALWSEAVKAARGTPLHGEALDMERELMERREAVRGKELAELDEAARALASAGEPGKAAALYEAARGRHPDGRWGSALTERTAALRRDAAETVRRLSDDAVEAAKKGDKTAVRAAEEVVGRLGYPELLAEFRAELAGVKPPEKPVAAAPPSAELLSYRAAWLKAVDRAVARDLEGAIAEHARISKDLKEADPKLEAKRDLEDLVTLRLLYAEAARIGERLPLTKDVALEVFGDDGARIKLKGKPLRAWPGRVELSGEPSIFVELGDLTAGSLADAVALTRKLGTLDVRALAFLCAAEGDAARASKLHPTMQGRIKELAKDGAARVPKRSDKERDARKLFNDAERAYRETATRAEAVALYQKLAAEYADAAIVKRDVDLVRRRAEEGREAFLGAGALKPAGTFKPSKDEKLGSVWTSAEDSEKAVANFLEFEFLAIGDTAYKAWIYAGGCCGEVFSCGLQATDLAGPKAASAAPGAEVFVHVRHGLSSLKAKHGDHLGPKSPKKWGWVALPLPKFPAGGPKVVRVLTNQKGFSVACAFVSSLKASPPGETDLRERLGRAKDGPTDPSLAAWWRLDEPGVESSGQGPAAQAKGTLEWLKDGRIGGAVKTGPGWLEAPHQAALNAFPITVCAWTRTRSTSDRAGLVNKYVRESSNGWSLHVTKGDARAWYFRSKDNKVMEGSDGLNAGPVNDGAWHHLAFVVDAEGGRLYVDGLRKAAQPWTGTAGPATSTTVVSVGAFPTSGSGPLDGGIDDARIYGRALSEAEIKALVVAGGGTVEDARPWTALFDGKTEFVHKGGGAGTWKVVDGAITKVGTANEAGQSRVEVEDGELRIRVETQGVSGFWFAARQGDEGRVYVELKGGVSDGPHEIVFLLAGDEVKATIDGKETPILLDRGRPRRGRIQFNFIGQTLRILAVDLRPLP